MEGSNRGFLEGAVHPLHLAIGLGVERFRQTMFDTMAMTYHIEDMRLVSFCAGLPGELHPIIGQHCMGAIRQRLERGFKEVSGHLPCHLLV